VVIEGFRLMAVGMTTVFVFLALLVALMRASAVFFEANAHRFPEEDSGDSGAAGNAVAKAGREEEIAIAIAIAVADAARRRGQGI